MTYLGPCSADGKVLCGNRRAAVMYGEMYFDFRLGWIYPADNRHWPRDLIREARPPFGWEFCPFCGGMLPDAKTVIRKIIDAVEHGEGEE